MLSEIPKRVQAPFYVRNFRKIKSVQLTPQQHKLKKLNIQKFKSLQYKQKTMRNPLVILSNIITTESQSKQHEIFRKTQRSLQGKRSLYSGLESISQRFKNKNKYNSFRSINYDTDNEQQEKVPMSSFSVQKCKFQLKTTLSSKKTNQIKPNTAQSLITDDYITFNTHKNKINKNNTYITDLVKKIKNVQQINQKSNLNFDYDLNVSENLEFKQNYTQSQNLFSLTQKQIYQFQDKVDQRLDQYAITNLSDRKINKLVFYNRIAVDQQDKVKAKTLKFRKIQTRQQMIRSKMPKQNRTQMRNKQQLNPWQTSHVNDQDDSYSLK